MIVNIQTPISICEIVLELERFVPVMTLSELHEFEKFKHGVSIVGISYEKVIEWSLAFENKKKVISSRVLEAIKKSDELCKIKEVRK